MKVMPWSPSQELPIIWLFCKHNAGPNDSRWTLSSSAARIWFIVHWLTPSGLHQPVPQPQYFFLSSNNWWLHWLWWWATSTGRYFAFHRFCYKEMLIHLPSGCRVGYQPGSHFAKGKSAISTARTQRSLKLTRASEEVLQHAIALIYNSAGILALKWPPSRNFWTAV